MLARDDRTQQHNKTKTKTQIAILHKEPSNKPLINDDRTTTSEWSATVATGSFKTFKWHQILALYSALVKTQNCLAHSVAYVFA